uniref:Uncharacterized protein n=1 Tax=viral metagenome TaxID=1070528 RepID=A0A6C0BTS3_9ZZZZ
MPQFSSLDEFKNINVLEWICINNGMKNEKTCFYSRSKYPSYYKPCHLKK